MKKLTIVALISWIAISSCAKENTIPSPEMPLTVSISVNRGLASEIIHIK